MNRRSQQIKLLLELSKNQDIDQGNLEQALQAITEAAVNGLGIERASVWTYNHDLSSIVCLDLFEKSKACHSSGLELKSADFPAYFRYLQQERTLPADNAETNPATREFADVYLRPLKIKSMLDAPIRKNGKMMGVVCSEKVGRGKKWSLTDQAFAGSLADLVTRAMVSQDRLKAQEDLRKLNENLEKMVQERTHELDVQRAATVQAAKLSSLGEMSAGVAHEINTPLAFIQLSVEQLGEMAEGGELDLPRLIQMTRDIESTTQRIAGIIKSLRSFSRDSAKDPFTETRVDNLVQETLTLCSQRIRSANIELKTDICTARLECRAPEIQQVIMNLLSNSIDAIPVAAQEKWIQLNAKEVHGGIEFSVTDSGVGIPAPHRQKIMQPFFTTKDIGKGTGLGLSVSAGIIKNHGGTLCLDTHCKNTRFVICLPQWQERYKQIA